MLATMPQGHLPSIVKNLYELLSQGESECPMYLYLSLQNKHFVTITSAYAFTTGLTEVKILSSYSELKQLIASFPMDNKVILLGDVHAREERNFYVWRCLGLHGSSNSKSNR